LFPNLLNKTWNIWKDNNKVTIKDKKKQKKIKHDNANYYPSNTNMSKYCIYHRNNGHTTNECTTLKDKVKELIRVRHLKCFVKRDDEGASRAKVL